METEKRFHVNGKHVHDRMNGDRICATCDSEDDAILWADTANGHHEDALRKA